MTGFLIAGTASGVGKTTITLAILAALRRRGLAVQPFKGGPDFLDTGHHTRIAGRVARNLDTWMLSADANKDVMRQASCDADAIVVEGMMGLFDGKDGAGEAGSTAEIAKLLGLPVVLVLDASKSARSIAAVVTGFERFDPQLSLAGVILNRVASERHFQMLETAITTSCRTPILGWLLREATIAIPERHLGLQTVEESEETTESLIETLGQLAEKHLDLERLLLLACEPDLRPEVLPKGRVRESDIRIAVARDRAFSFYYEDNFDLLRQYGAAIVPFSPLHDSSLPEDVDALYLGGGYPELYAPLLSTNTSMLASIQAFAASGRPVYAECGGMMYLSQTLTTSDEITYAMAGVLPFEMEMTDRLVRFGYVTAELTDDCLLGARGTVIRGHSFHYSRIVNAPEIRTSYRVQYSLSGKEENEGYSFGNVLASYVHLHFRAAPAAAQSLAENARRMRSAPGARIK
jgi:cobyrinic acid a,c-diamide synthase